MKELPKLTSKPLLAIYYRQLRHQVLFLLMLIACHFQAYAQDPTKPVIYTTSISDTGMDISWDPSVSALASNERYQFTMTESKFTMPLSTPSQIADEGCPYSSEQTAGKIAPFSASRWIQQAGNGPDTGNEAWDYNPETFHIGKRHDFFAQIHYDDKAEVYANRVLITIGNGAYPNKLTIYGAVGPSTNELSDQVILHNDEDPQFSPNGQYVAEWTIPENTKLNFYKIQFSEGTKTNELIQLNTANFWHDPCDDPPAEYIAPIPPGDITSPVITLLAANPIEHVYDTPFTDPGYTATDDFDGDLSASVVVTGSVDINKVGSYTLSYDVSDANNNAATTVMRTVNVIDNTPPVITLLGDDPIQHDWNTPFTDPGATALDNVDGDISSNIVADIPEIGIEKLGTYTITYDVVDESGNAATTVTRTVNVVDPADRANPWNPNSYSCPTDIHLTMFNAINDFRVANGKAKASLRSDIVRVADLHAWDNLVNRPCESVQIHKWSGQGEWTTWMEQQGDDCYGYRSNADMGFPPIGGQNLIFGHGIANNQKALDVVNGWINSPGVHPDNMLCDNCDIGVGIYTDPAINKTMWVFFSSNPDKPLSDATYIAPDATPGTCWSDPIPPTDPVVSLSNITETSMDINWTAATSNAEIKNYQLIVTDPYGIEKANESNLSASTLSYSLTGLVPGTQYDIVLKAENNIGQFSNEVTTSGTTLQNTTGGGVIDEDCDNITTARTFVAVNNNVRRWLQGNGGGPYVDPAPWDYNSGSSLLVDWRIDFWSLLEHQTAYNVYADRLLINISNGAYPNNILIEGYKWVEGETNNTNFTLFSIENPQFSPEGHFVAEWELPTNEINSYKVTFSGGTRNGEFVELNSLSYWYSHCDAPPAEYNPTTPTTPPTDPIVSVDNTTETQITVSWTPSVSDIGIKNYHLEVSDPISDAVLITKNDLAANSNSFTLTGQANTTYRFTLKAEDVDGNFSGESVVDGTTLAGNPDGGDTCLNNGLTPGTTSLSAVKSFDANTLDDDVETFGVLEENPTGYFTWNGEVLANRFFISIRNGAYPNKIVVKGQSQLTSTNFSQNILVVLNPQFNAEGQFIGELDLPADIPLNRYQFNFRDGTTTGEPMHMNTLAIWDAECDNPPAELIPPVFSAPPKEPIVSVNNITETSMDINWTAATSNEGIKNYHLTVTNPSGHEIVNLPNIGASILTHTLTGLTPGTQYDIVLKAEANDGQFSNEVTNKGTTLQGSSGGGTGGVDPDTCPYAAGETFDGYNGNYSRLFEGDGTGPRAGPKSWDFDPSTYTDVNWRLDFFAEWKYFDSNVYADRALFTISNGAYPNKIVIEGRRLENEQNPSPSAWTVLYTKENPSFSAEGQFVAEWVIPANTELNNYKIYFQNGTSNGAYIRLNTLNLWHSQCDNAPAEYTPVPDPCVAVVSPSGLNVITNSTGDDHTLEWTYSASELSKVGNFELAITDPSASTTNHTIAASTLSPDASDIISLSLNSYLTNPVDGEYTVVLTAKSPDECSVESSAAYNFTITTCVEVAQPSNLGVTTGTVVVDGKNYHLQWTYDASELSKVGTFEVLLNGPDGFNETYTLEAGNVNIDANSDKVSLTLNDYWTNPAEGNYTVTVTAVSPEGCSRVSSAAFSFTVTDPADGIFIAIKSAQCNSQEIYWGLGNNIDPADYVVNLSLESSMDNAVSVDGATSEYTFTGLLTDTNYTVYANAVHNATGEVIDLGSESFTTPTEGCDPDLSLPKEILTLSDGPVSCRSFTVKISFTSEDDLTNYKLLVANNPDMVEAVELIPENIDTYHTFFNLEPGENITAHVRLINNSNNEETNYVFSTTTATTDCDGLVTRSNVSSTCNSVTLRIRYKDGVASSDYNLLVADNEQMRGAKEVDFADLSQVLYSVEDLSAGTDYQIHFRIYEKATGALLDIGRWSASTSSEDCPVDHACIDKLCEHINIDESGNVVADGFIGDGSQITNINADNIINLPEQERIWQRETDVPANIFYKEGLVKIGNEEDKKTVLEVNGGLVAKKMAVYGIPSAFASGDPHPKWPGWPDYVFTKEYKLPSLVSVEAFIKKEQHLPDVPSAADVEKDGLDMGTMDATLLKKVEELTLYLIEQNKTLLEQQEKLTGQHNKLMEQQQKLEGQNKRIEQLEEQLSNQK